LIVVCVLADWTDDGGQEVGKQRGKLVIVQTSRYKNEMNALLGNNDSRFLSKDNRQSISAERR